MGSFPETYNDPSKLECKYSFGAANIQLYTANWHDDLDDEDQIEQQYM